MAFNYFQKNPTTHFLNHSPFLFEMNPVIIASVLLQACTSYNTQQLTEEQKANVEDVLVRGGEYFPFVQDFVSAANQNRVFGIEDGAESFLELYADAVDTVKQYHNHGLIVSIDPEEYPEKEGNCTAFSNSWTGEKYIFCDENLLEYHLAADGIFHEGAHAFLNSVGIDSAHAEELAHLIESYGDSQNYTKKTAKLVVKYQDIAYALSLVLGPAEIADDRLSIKYQLGVTIDNTLAEIENGTMTEEEACEHISVGLSYYMKPCDDRAREKRIAIGQIYNYLDYFGVDTKELEQIILNSGLCEISQEYAQELVQEYFDCTW